MSIATGTLVLLAAVVGGVVGWWPLAEWTERSLRHERAPRRVLRACAAGLTAIVWALVVWRIGAAPVLPAVLAFGAAATVLAIVDLLERRLPNRVLAPAVLIAAALLTVASAVSGGWGALLGASLGGAAMFGTFIAVALVSPSAMGMGDVKLAGLIGLLLGWFGLEAWLVGLLAAFLIGGVGALAALALRRVSLHGSIPFGPSLLSGALLAVLLIGPPAAPIG